MQNLMQSLNFYDKKIQFLFSFLKRGIDRLHQGRGVCFPLFGCVRLLDKSWPCGPCRGPGLALYICKVGPCVPIGALRNISTCTYLSVCIITTMSSIHPKIIFILALEGTCLHGYAIRNIPSCKCLMCALSRQRIIFFIEGHFVHIGATWNILISMLHVWSAEKTKVFVKK